MRLITLLFGLVLMVLAGLWFFTPVLDSTYSKHAPQYAHPRSAAKQSGPAATSGGTRGAAPEARTAQRSSGTSGGGISSKALADNVMSMINVGAGILGAWFTFMSYRMQVRDRQRRRRDEA
jgi:hypothetical protein